MTSTLSALDLCIVLVFLVFLTGMALHTRRYLRSVSGFLAADRCAGRYLISVAFNMAQLGVITLVWYFQQNYDVGFTSIWWSLMEGPAWIFLSLTGWVVYRFRATRALTLAEFFERRYSRRFRVFSGLVAFLSGMINYGVFPGVAARFFMAIGGLPEHFGIAGTQWSTLPVLMAALMLLALLFVNLGGQIAVMVTDFLQGVFSNFVFLAVIAYLLWTIPWEHFADTLLGRVHDGRIVADGVQNPLAGRSPVHPFHLQAEENFNPIYWVIQVIVMVYGWRAWQGDQGYNASARTAHEARMANVLNGWRWRVLMLITLVLPLAIRTMMHHPAYAAQAAQVNEALSSFETGDDAGRSELRTPLATALLLPSGLLGLMVAAMLGAFLSTNDTYLHSWGSIFVQDVLLPLRRRPLPRRDHLRTIRLSTLGVAVFAFLFSLYYRPSEYIAMFLAITGAIFVGGAGAAIVGGLYWRRGTTAGAWAGMITGMVLASGRIVIKTKDSDPEYWIERSLVWLSESALAPLGRLGLYLRHDLTGQEMTFWAIALAAAAYVLVSLVTCRKPYDLDRLLHRGAYARGDETTAPEAAGSKIGFWEKLGLDREFTGRDRWVTIVTLSWPLVWTGIFLVGFLDVFRGASEESWLGFWHGYTWLVFLAGLSVMIWFTIGGFRDLRELFRRLGSHQEDVLDDGQVHEAEGSAANVATAKEDRR